MTPEKKHQLRLKTIGDKGTDRCGLIYFGDLTGKQAALLLAKGVADPDGTQNDSPTFAAITAFLLENPAFRGHGYVVGPERPDHRITLEGVQADGEKFVIPPGQVDNFVKMFRQADEFESKQGGQHRAWYD